MPSSSNSNGLLVDTLTYRFRGIENEHGQYLAGSEQPGKVLTKEVKVQVRLLKEYEFESEGKNRPPRRLWFSLSCKNPKFRLEGSDIEALRAAAWDYLDSHYAVKWSRYYLVQIRPRMPVRGLGAGFDFSYSEVQRGVAHDGTLLLREYIGGSRGFEIRPWPGEFKDSRGRLMACIPDTKENTAALEEFARMVEQMRQRLAEFLKPEHIAETLGNLSDLRLIGSREDDPS